MAILLAGDLGGTKTLLGLFESAHSPPLRLKVSRFRTLDFDGLHAMIKEFLTGHRGSIESACLGVSGPVQHNASNLTNIPWLVDAEDISVSFSIPCVRLLNDVTAAAYAIPQLTERQLEFLQTGHPDAKGNAALIASGTGLGESILQNLHGTLIPTPSEGGHADFAARTPDEQELVKTLTLTNGRVSCEEILSGQGLVHLHRFVHGSEDCVGLPVGVPRFEQPFRITRAGIRKECEGCTKTVNLFVEALGSEAGNLGLRSMATAGVYVGGGIPPQILPALRNPLFLQAFTSKFPMSNLLKKMPVAVILDTDTPLIGAAIAAQELNTRHSGHSA